MATPQSRAKKNKKQSPKKVIDELFEPVAEEEAPEHNGGKYYGKFVPKIQKRDGSIVAFDFVKILRAIRLAMKQEGEGSAEEAEMVAHPKG